MEILTVIFNGCVVFQCMPIFYFMNQFLVDGILACVQWDFFFFFGNCNKHQIVTFPHFPLYNVHIIFLGKLCRNAVGREIFTILTSDKIFHFIFFWKIVLYMSCRFALLRREKWL